MQLPENIAALTTVTKADIAAVDAWAKSVHPEISVTWSECRAAPPRKIHGPHRGESIEQARARDPGPPQITITVVEKRTGQKSMQRLTVGGRLTGESTLDARIELAAMLEQQQQAIKTHSLPEAVQLSGYDDDDLEALAKGNEPTGRRSWDYPEATAKHLDLSGTLCPESVASAAYVEREARIHELRQLIAGDWKTRLVEMIETAFHLATNTSRGTRTQTYALRAAAEQAIARRARAR